MSVRSACVVQAPAKVNLFLHVGRRRQDGFHEIDTLFQAVSLWDRVVVRRSDGEVTLGVDGPDLGPVESNLAVRAARAFLDATDMAGGVSVELTKGIPAGAGLGGGSSDAAAVLRALNHLVGSPLGGAGLMELGAALGSDVPFFLGASTLARGRGRGEILEPLPPLPPAELLLVLPPVHVSTGAAYAALGRGPGDDDMAGAGPGPGGWREVVEAARNDFQEVVAGMHPEVALCLEALRAEGAERALLSGSGAACFGLFTGAGDAAAAGQRLEARLGWPAPVVRTLAALPGPELVPVS